MSNTPRNLTRNQLSEFLPNQRAVRAFEQLLQQVSTLLPSDVTTLNRLITESYIEASSASARADQALDTLISIQQSLDRMSKAPTAQPTQVVNDVTPPVRAPGLSELPDASVKLPVAGNLLIYDATLKLWKSAVLTPGTNVTITNADGAITVNSSSSAVEIHAATSKATPVDDDEMPLADSASLFSLKKLTWANLKATLATWLGGNNISVSVTSVTTAGSVQLNNAQYVQSKNAAGTSTRMLGINSGNTVYLGSVDTSDVTTMFINLSGVNRISIDTTGMTIVGDVTTAGGAVLHKTTAALTNGAGAGAGTLMNAPAAGNPTKWVAINDSGTTRYIPTW